jgi:hypothetical protein
LKIEKLFQGDTGIQIKQFFLVTLTRAVYLKADISKSIRIRRAEKCFGKPRRELAGGMELFLPSQSL